MGQRLRRGLRWLLGRALSAMDQAEQGLAAPQAGHAGAAAPEAKGARRLAVVTTDAGALIPPNDKLLVFRSLTGIDTVPALTDTGHTSRAAPNIGIYARAVRAERSAARSYRFFDTAINVCLGVQIVVAASLTALGAANGSGGAVTAFGALNTIIAGILTYLKGSGLPGKLKHVEEQYKMVREYAEQREREFCLAGCPLEPLDEVQAVHDMYQAARQQTPGAGGGGAGPGLGAAAAAASTAGGPPLHMPAALSSLAQRFSKLADAAATTAATATTATTTQPPADAEKH